VELAFDLTRHAVVGLSEVARHYFKFRRFRRRLLELAWQRRPDVIIGVDFSGFNGWFRHALRRHLHGHRRRFNNWRPRFVQYVSPQVWASRPGRAYRLATELDLLLCLFPFEPAWYRRHTPKLPVEFVGHPLVDRYPRAKVHDQVARPAGAALPGRNVLLLPGSRMSELRCHLPVMLGAAQTLVRLDRERRVPPVSAEPLRFTLVCPDESLRAVARSECARVMPGIEIKTGGLAEALTRATIAMASTGTVTLECAWFGVPTVALYRTSWPTYLVARPVVTVSHLSMPNLLAGEVLFPEFIQHRATVANLAAAAHALLVDETRRDRLRLRLAEVMRQLGPPEAAARAAAAVARLLPGGEPRAGPDERRETNQ
jgi:lipid-A-disaccharide synthase